MGLRGRGRHWPRLNPRDHIAVLPVGRIPLVRGRCRERSGLATISTATIKKMEYFVESRESIEQIRREYVTLAESVQTANGYTPLLSAYPFARVPKYGTDRIRAEEYTTQTFVVNVIGEISDS